MGSNVFIPSSSSSLTIAARLLIYSVHCDVHKPKLNLAETSDAVGTVSHILSYTGNRLRLLDISIAAINRACIDKLLSQSVGTLGRWPVLHTRQMKVEVGDMLPIKRQRHEAVANLILNYSYCT